MKGNNQENGTLLPDGLSAGAQFVFIDGSIPDAQALAQGGNPGVTAVVLDPGSDGVQQIADWLTSHDVQNAAAIDIVAHGADGLIQLGSALLSSATMAGYSSQLAQIGNALQPGGDIQLYGCDVAQDPAGVAFLQQLSQATGGANIAASSHLVGSAADGGSWNLNVDIGTVDAGNPFTAAAINNFTNELALSSDQLFFTVQNGQSGSPQNAGNRVQQISVNGTNAASNPVDLSDGNANNNAIDLVNGIAVDAPLNEFFIANSNTKGVNGHSYYGLFRGVTNPSGPDQTLTKFYDAPHNASVNGVILGTALDQPNGQLYFVQNTFDYGAGTYVTNQTGIFKISVTGGAAIPLVSTGSGLSAENIAIDTKDNLIFFTAFNLDASFTELGVVLDAANLSTGGNIQTVASISTSSAFPGGVAVDPNTHTAYFTTRNGTTVADNGIFDVGFTVSGIGNGASISHIGAIGTLYSGSTANVPKDIAIDPANGVFFVAGQTPFAGGQAAAILAGSLTNTNTAATLTQVFDITQAETSTAALNDNAHNLVLLSTPTISASGIVTYTQGGASITLAPSASVANQDGQNLKTATVVVSGGFLAGDTLTATTAGTNISSSFSSGTLTLTGAGAAGGDTLANFQAVLDSVKYNTTNTNPTQNGTDNTRTISWTLSDGIVSSTTPTTTVNIHAAFITAGSTVTFTGGGSPVVLDGSLITGDSVGSNFTSATVTVGNFLNGDTLNFNSQNGITGSFNSGTLTLTGSSSFANYQAALQSITYSFSPGQDPTNGGADKSRTISWIVNDGTVVSPSASSTLNINHAAPTITASGTATYPESGSPVVLDSGVVVSDPDSPTLTSATVSIGGFLTSDVLATDATGTAITPVYNNTTGVLTLTGTDTLIDYQTVLRSVTFSNSGDPTAGGTDTSRSISWVVNDGVASSSASTSSVATLCFCAGTRIATPHGEVAIERLAIGDSVLTIDGRWLPIRWIGTGHSLLPIGRRTDATPVIVRAGALADGVPRRDLRVTKGHSLYLDGVLVPVEHLINHRTILWDDEAHSVTVYHLELDTHEVLLAEGAPAESYRDDGNRVQFHNANPAWDGRAPLEPYGPIVTDGPVVSALWQRLMRRAEPRPATAFTTEPDLHLLVDGVRVDPSSVEQGIHSFELAAMGQEMRLASRSGVPAELGINEDQRRLGVAVQRIVLRQSGMVLDIIADSPLLDVESGFHGYEADGGFRWTNGAALVPLRLLAAFAAGGLTLEVHVGCTAHYPAGDGALLLAA